MPAHHRSLPPDKEQLALQICRISRNARVSSELFTAESCAAETSTIQKGYALLRGVGHGNWDLGHTSESNRAQSFYGSPLRCCCSATAVQRANARPPRSTPYRKKHW